MIATKSIHELLAQGPDALSALSETELVELLRPYFPATRSAVLPDERPQKVGVEHRLVMSALAANKDALAALKTARSK